MCSLPYCLVVMTSRMRLNLFYLNWDIDLNLLFFFYLPAGPEADDYSDYSKWRCKQESSLMDQSKMKKPMWI